MIRQSRAMRLLVSGVVFLASGCGEESPNDPIAAVPSAGPGGASPVAPATPAGPASNPKLKEIMVKIGRGPQALQGALGSAMKQPTIPWDVVQAKSHEYGTLSAELGKHDPVKGTKDSWAKLTAAFSETADELDKAAQAKDKDRTVAALDSLGSSCQACHREHRIMGPPGGGFPRGGPPGGPGMAKGAFRPPGQSSGPAASKADAPPPSSPEPAGEAKEN